MNTQVAQQQFALAKSWWVYLLRLSDGTLYCGCTSNVDLRLATHRRGKGSRLVRARLPFVLAYCEEILTGGRSAAQKREAEIKRFTKQKKEDLCASTEVFFLTPES